MYLELKVVYLQEKYCINVNGPFIHDDMDDHEIIYLLSCSYLILSSALSTPLMI